MSDSSKKVEPKQKNDPLGSANDQSVETAARSEAETKKVNTGKHIQTADSPETTSASSEPSTSNETAKKATTTPKKSLWGKLQSADTGADGQADAKTDTDSQKATLKSVAQRVNRQIKAMTLIKQWTQMTSHSQFANNEDHLQYLRSVAKHATTDLPDPLIATVREEVLPILQDTLKQYKMELGVNHHLTQEMQSTIQRMKEEANSTSAKDTRKDINFFRRLSNVFSE